MADAAFDSRAAQALDRALGGATPSDPAVAGLVAVAERLRDGISPDVPDFRAQRVAFVQAAVQRRKGWSWMRFFGPATVTAIALLVAVMIGRTALPGETFYPVRQALRAVGLAPFSLTEIDGEIDRAKKLLVQAEGLKNRDLDEARAIAFEAVKVLGFTEEILAETQDQGSGRDAQVKALLRRAQAILLLDEKDRSRKDRQTGDDGKDSPTKNGPKEDPPGNSGAVRNDQRDDRDRGNNGKNPEPRADRGNSADKRRDTGGASGSNKGSGSGPSQDDDGLDDDDEVEDDFDDGNNGRGNDDKKEKEKDKDDDDDEDGVTPSPEETVDGLRGDVEDEIRRGHGGLKGPRGDNEDRDRDDEDGDD